MSMTQERPKREGAPHSGLAQAIQELFDPSRIESALAKTERMLLSAADALETLRGKENGTDNKSAAPGKGFLDTLGLIFVSALERPEPLAQHVSAFASAVLEILRRNSDIAPPASDRRFSEKLWQDSAVLRGLMQIYLAWGEHLQKWADEQEFDAQDRLRVEFIFNQITAALSPSNLPIHPSALKRAEQSAGMSAVAGIRNFVQDAQSNRFMPRQINPGAYALGTDLAYTPGAVVMRTPMMELIQYQPQTQRVRSRALMMVPPQINKYYIFDLKQRNSILGFLVREGYQVFTISWKNPKRDSADWGLDHYVTAVLTSVNAIRAITGMDSVNLVSACAGGLTAMGALGYLAETSERSVNSHSLLVTALLPDSGSTLELFTTEQSLELARTISRREGTMDGMDLAHLFAWLRPNELVWSYWVNNNLLGRQPPPLDVLHWDNDSTRMPAQLHSDFIDTYLLDVFQSPRRQKLFGLPIDYSKVDMDTYFVGGTDDYLMPWRGIYKAARLFRGRHRFIVSTGGHVQTILRPPALANISYYSNQRFPGSADEWLKGAELHSGSWWSDWSAWLAKQSGPVRAAPVRLGSAAFSPIMAAPGSYVHERMDAD
jgi:polyhydroxyalkanoate synthase subunit PhaC